MSDTPFGPSGIDQGTDTLDAATIADVLRQNRGNITKTARDLDRNRTALARRIDGSPELKAVLQEVRDELLDQAETNVFDAVENGDLGESHFILTMLGKERGYVTRQELNTKDFSVAVRQFSDSPPNSPPGDADGG